MARHANAACKLPRASQAASASPHACDDMSRHAGCERLSQPASQPGEQRVGRRIAASGGLGDGDWGKAAREPEREAAADLLGLADCDTGEAREPERVAARVTDAREPDRDAERVADARREPEREADGEREAVRDGDAVAPHGAAPARRRSAGGACAAQRARCE